MGIELGRSNQQSGIVLGGGTPSQPVDNSLTTGVANGGGIQLTKGQKLDLTKGNPGLNLLKVGLGWDVNAHGSASYDLDAEAFILNQSGKVISPKHVVYYNNLVSPDGAIRHAGDNRTGQGDGDDEVIHIDLLKVSSDAERVVFVVTIDQALVKNQNFGQVNNAYIRVLDGATNAEICRFDLTEDHSSSISLIVGEVYRHNGEWKFGALGQGSTLDLAGICSQYGAM